MTDHDERPGHDHGQGLAALALGALGVVYGDIGTSPLYAMKEAFTGAHGLPPTQANVYGVLSLIFWSLNFVISFKYIGFVMRADNRGEGGIIALLALVRSRKATGRGQAVLVGLGLLGAALLYGEGIITPAISVLGAVEGIAVASPTFAHFVVPIALLILVGLFWFQHHGTDRIGKAFGPIMVVWFLSIAALGIRGIALHPEVLRAVNPWYAVEFFINDRLEGFLILGAVVLVITGGEALYADMGHFGRKPIRMAWFFFALPALLLNYFGQAGLLLETPGVANPFFALAPEWFLYPMIGIATLAAIVASQALISGAFSLTRQAVQLGYSPRVTIVHTSRTEAGQIYIPEVNHTLAVGCILLVLGFRSATNLAAAYGIAVTGTMAISTLLFFRVARDLWNWKLVAAAGLCTLFLLVDLSFFGANIIKFADGGWFPIVVAAAVYTLMTTWKRGRAKLTALVQQSSLPIDLFLADVAKRPPLRVPGTAIVLTSAMDIAPPVLLHSLKHNKVLHQRVILLSIVTEEVPTVPVAERLECRELGEGFWRVVGRYGFMESPDVPALLTLLGETDVPGSPGHVFLTQTSFFLGRETLIATPRAKQPKRLPGDPRPMSYWRRRLFIIMTRNARSATAFFGLPPNRVVELGAQIQI
ncbi:MAG TPA: KUP/HAK/KT family potassium transporter [Gemmatimonadales bacterium]|nr:KUP/HAK/KT family potassium transporter [Gemmatimonadales bacterium]HRZ08347.1 KUP/HAK/KT family potassium transporter [Gemmatimonadales bacterium]